jgi:hypothetical protein
MGEVVWVSFSIRELSKNYVSNVLASQIVGLVGLMVPIVIFNDAVVENFTNFALIIT